MSFDKYFGKDWRKSYRKAKSISSSCRNHGSCPWCEENRLYKNKKRKVIAQEKLEDFLKGVYF